MKPKMGMQRLPHVDYGQAPFLVIWEMTQACDLACLHCRASAQPNPDSAELTTDEAKGLLRQVAGMGTPIFILSGGDPLKRADLFELVRYGADLGLRMATIPAATDRLTEEVVMRLKEAGLSQMALSLDYPRADLHDAFRGVPGAFAKTMQAIEWAHKHELPLQINTTLHAGSLPYLEEMAALVETLDIVFWEVFYLVPTGRGSSLGGLTAQECERTFDLLYKVQKQAGYLVKITEAPHFRRYVMQRERHAGGMRGRPQQGESLTMPEQLTRTEGPGHTIGLAPQGVNSGNGFLFVSHRGEIFPSGFLPLPAGNVRRHKLAWVYRHAPVFRQLRSPEQLKGACGDCEYNALCGGSRSRAFALSGDYLAADPWCVYRPARKDTPVTQSA